MTARIPDPFAGGIGVFGGSDRVSDRPIIARGVWDQITRTSCRWNLAFSGDGGKSFEDNWFMH